MSAAWGLILVVVMMNLFAVGVFTGHTQRALQALRRFNERLKQWTYSPQDWVREDYMRRMFPAPEVPGHLYVIAVLIIALTVLGLFLVFVSSFG